MPFTKDKYLKYKIEERIERSGIRQWLNENKQIAAALIISCILFSIIVMIIKSMPDNIVTPTLERKAWFYDLNTDKLFIENDLQRPPVAAPSG